jgi:hypothetical protein
LHLICVISAWVGVVVESQAIVDLVRHHVTHHVFPAFDPSVSAPGGGGPAAGGAGGGTPAKGAKRRKSGAGAAAAGGATATVRALAARMAALLRQLAALAALVRVQVRTSSASGKFEKPGTTSATHGPARAGWG